MDFSRVRLIHPPAHNGPTCFMTMKPPSFARQKSLFLQTCILAVLLGVASFRASGQVDLIAHWQLDENSGTATADTTANRNDGTLTNGPIWAPGYIGNALSFDGVNDYVQVPNSASLGITTDITLAAWVKRAALGDYGGIVAKT